MALPSRLSLEALLVRLELEPGEADVWVEGPFDRTVYSLCLRAYGIRGIAIHNIEDLEVPSEMTWTSGGNRERLLAVADHVEAMLGSDLHNLVCCIDRDHDYLLYRDRQYGPYVLPTDHTCIESYMWDPQNIEKLATVYFGADELEGEKIQDALAPVLEELYLIRTAQITLNLPGRLASARRLIKVSPGPELVFDRDEYIVRLLNAGASADRADDLRAKTEEIRAELVTLGMPYMNGHDFTDLLGLVLSEMGTVPKRVQIEKDRLSRGLAACVDWKRVAETSDQIGQLVERLSDFSR